jgi:uncharacterized membrane protein
MEPWTGSNESTIADILGAIFTLFVVIGVIMFAAKMIFRGDSPKEVMIDEEKEDD